MLTCTICCSVFCCTVCCWDVASWICCCCGCTCTWTFIRTTAIVKCLEDMNCLETGVQSYRTCQLQQWPRHFCAVSVDAVGFLMVDHSGGCRGCVCTLLTKLLQRICTLAGQRLQELLHAMLWYTASLLPHKLLVRARAIQGVIHCWKQSLLMRWGSEKKELNL